MHVYAPECRHLYELSSSRELSTCRSTCRLRLGYLIIDVKTKHRLIDFELLSQKAKQKVMGKSNGPDLVGFKILFKFKFE